MTCRQIDQLLCDYLDGALPFDQQQAFEQHLQQCSACSQAVADSEFSLSVVKKTPAIEAPIELIADIIHDTIGVRGTLPMLAPAGAPSAPGAFGWLRPLFSPLLQPRFAMSMVMAVLSLSMLTFYAKGALENWQSGRSNPVAVVGHIGDQFKRAWDATAEFFETVRGMYQLQEFAREPLEDFEQTPPPQAGPPEAATQPPAPQPAQPETQPLTGEGTAATPPAGQANQPGTPGQPAERSPRPQAPRLGQSGR
jgi:hypothetical protein